ncbi:MAG TPA: TIGR04282 family arsenosugar biosynthesis glycosyltransferase [Candidatus Avalokitesvara rifleensis]|uniref:TIGR04282 family arsenosugar biosynthesis glycosyltransferase n=1 Tax=Candidatus Avalokitesvara rifleensis TaxID=3367620 RepID=UPI004028B00B
MSTEDVLMIFVKYPEPGKVKTRLAKTLGAKEAARLYRIMAEDVIRRLGTNVHGKYDTIIFFDPPDRASDIKDWLGNGRSYTPQSGRDLGEKLANAFHTVFNSGARRAVVIGTDCLSITGEIITEALQHLEKKDVVIGPAEDGGYYLLGLSRNIPELFDSVDWSTDKVFRQTVEKAQRLGLSHTTLEPLKDLDEPSDLSPTVLQMLRQKNT